MDKRLAFEVFIDDLTCITFAPTAKAAQYNAVLNAREAGYYNRRGQWPNSHPRRKQPNIMQYLTPVRLVITTDVDSGLTARQSALRFMTTVH